MLFLWSFHIANLFILPTNPQIRSHHAKRSPFPLPLFSGGDFLSFTFAPTLSSLALPLRSFVKTPAFLTKMRIAGPCLIGESSSLLPSTVRALREVPETGWGREQPTQFIDLIPRSYSSVEILAPDMMALGSRTFGRWLGCEGLSRISAYTIGPTQLPLPFAMWCYDHKTAV